jgi:hypothetical protein
VLRAATGVARRGLGNRSARRRCSFRRKREEDTGAYDNAHYVVALASANMMLFIGRGIRSRINSGQQVLIRITPDAPNPFNGITDPFVS